jgi:hypothetical protein
VILAQEVRADDIRLDRVGLAVWISVVWELPKARFDSGDLAPDLATTPIDDDTVGQDDRAQQPGSLEAPGEPRELVLDHQGNDVEERVSLDIL